VFLQTTLAAEAHLAEGRFLLQEQTLNKAKSLMYREGTRRPATIAVAVITIIIETYIVCEDE
jgi:hypothetical protein